MTNLDQSDNNSNKTSRAFKFIREVSIIITTNIFVFILALCTANYGASKTNQLNINKERISSLQKDLFLLNKTAKEIELNYKLLNSQDFVPHIKCLSSYNKFKGVSNVMDSLHVNNENDQVYIQQVKYKIEELVKSLTESDSDIIECYIPKRSFVTDTWYYVSKPEASEINYELISELNDFYRKISNINFYNNSTYQLATYDTKNIPMVKKNLILSNSNYVKDEIGSVNKEVMPKLLNRIQVEIKRLENELNRIKN